MNIVLLQPTDILFFRDGRPMGAASSGQGAAWPLPNVINHAFHAALHRAQIEGVHKHVPGRSSSHRDYSDANRNTNGRLFGALTTLGPFPVCTDGAAPTWFFPRPADAGQDGIATLHPIQKTGHSSLPSPLMNAVGNTRPPSKEFPNPWWSEGAWNAYLGSAQRNAIAARSFYKGNNEFADTEHNYGIGINPETGSVVDGQFYSAHYLRLRPGWGLGAITDAWDKDLKADLVEKLLNGHGREIITGGQLRVCTATLVERESDSARLPLPVAPEIRGTRVKWILLSPAIWPEIEAGTNKAGNPIHSHSGGWLPNWIAEEDQLFEGEHVEKGSVLLLDGPGKEKAKRKHLEAGKTIKAKLVAAITSKAIPVTGYALPNSADPDRAEGGAKPTHLAVPAGAVYYFEAATESDAQALAAALNWHGASPGTEVKNRRSTLMGEKGFGLGVCGMWNFQPTNAS